jgi:hypothetical protein
VGRITGGIALAGTGIMVLFMAALHVLRPDLSPLSEPMSFYGPGPYGYLFTISLGGFAVALAALAVGLQVATPPEARSTFGTAFVGVAAVGAAVAAGFQADLPGAAHTTHGILHGLGGPVVAQAAPARPVATTAHKATAVST